MTLPILPRRLNRGTVLLTCAVALCAVAVSVFGARPARNASAPQGQDTSQAAATDQSSREYVRRGGLWPSLHSALAAAGDRLERPGKERTVLSGTVSLGDGSAPAPFSLAREYPDALVVEHHSGGGRNVIRFDGTRPPLAERALTPGEEALLETLLYDTPDHFFRAQSDGSAATRFLGPRFRLGEDGGGSAYDVYETTEQVMTAGGASERTRRYYFNSDTHLLERVRYQTERGGRGVEVEVTLGYWQSVSGQALPMRVVRAEDGTPILTVTLGAASVGPSARVRTTEL